MATNKLTKKQLAKLNTESELFAPPKSDREQMAEDLDAIKGNALAYATDAQLQQAKRAIANTRRLASGMSGLARALTKDPNMKVVVRADVNSSQTDGRSIIVKPNFELGAETEHKRQLCGEIDSDTELQLCPACASLDATLDSLYHEIGHIAFGTFEPVPEDEKAEIVKRSIAERGAHVGTRAKKLLDLLEKMYGPLQAMPAAKIISPYLPMLLNALEDARVNAATGRVNSGLDRIFRARTRDTLANGITDQQGRVYKWSERSLDEQALIGCYLVASGYVGLLDHLDPAVATMFKTDFDLRVELNKIANAPSVHVVYAAAFPVLERLRAAGFCVRKDDPEDDEQEQVLAIGMMGQPDGDGEAQGDASGLSGTALPDVVDVPDPNGSSQGDDEPADESADENADEPVDGSGADDETDAGDDDGAANDEPADGDESDDEPGNGAATRGTGEDDSDGNGDGSEPDVDAIDEALKLFQGHDPDGKVWQEGTDKQDDLMRAVDAQFDQFDAPSRTVLRMNVHEWAGDKTKAVAWGHSMWSHAPVEVESKDYNQALGLARIVFGNNAAVKRDPMQRSGQINQAHLCHVPAGMKRPFKRTRFPNGRDYKICMTLDVSGSTQGTRNNMIRQVGLGTAKVLHQLPGVDFEIWGHTATYADDGGWSYNDVIYQGDMHQIKAFGQPWGTQQVAALQALHASMDNLDGHTLEFCRKRIETQRATDRIIFYLTDGEMPAANREDEIDVLVRELEYCKRNDIKVIGIGVNTDSPTKWGLDTIRVDDPSDLRHLFQEIGKRLA
jgi:hypothetical protein